MNLPRLELLGRPGKRPIIRRRAIGIIPRRRIRLMQRQPLVRLLDRVVVKLVVYPPRAQGFEQITMNIPGKLGSMNGDGCGGQHDKVVANLRSEAKCGSKQKLATAAPN